MLEANAVCHPVCLRVPARHGQRRVRDVGRGHVDLRSFRGERDRDGAAPRAYVEHLAGGCGWEHFERVLDERFRIRPRDQHVSVHLEAPSVELAAAENVGNGLPLPPARDQWSNRAPLLFQQRSIEVQIQADPVDAERTRNEKLRV